MADVQVDRDPLAPGPFIAFSKSSGVANSFGSILEWLCMATVRPCFLATGATRSTTFWLAEAVIAGTPMALAMANPRSISSSEKSSLKL